MMRAMGLCESGKYSSTQKMQVMMGAGASLRSVLWDDIAISSQILKGATHQLDLDFGKEFLVDLVEMFRPLGPTYPYSIFGAEITASGDIKITSKIMDDVKS